MTVDLKQMFAWFDEIYAEKYKYSYLAQGILAIEKDGTATNGKKEMLIYFDESIYSPQPGFDQILWIRDKETSVFRLIESSFPGIFSHCINIKDAAAMAQAGLQRRDKQDIIWASLN